MDDLDRMTWIDLDDLDWEIQLSAVGMYANLHNYLLIIVWFFLSIVQEHLTSSTRLGTKVAYNTNVVSAPPSTYVHFGWTPASLNPSDAISHVKSNQSFSQGCHFWEVDTSNARYWKLGIVNRNLECYLQNSHDSLCVFLGQTMITAKGFSTALKVVRVELDCRRNTLSFYNASVEDRDAAESLGLLETVSIPSNYPAYAIFGVLDGSLKLL